MRKGNVTILASIFAMLLVAMGIGAGTMAWFSSTKTVGPTIVAGTVNLRLSKDGITWDDHLEFDFPTGFAPGDDFEIHVYLKNNDNAGSRTVWVYGDNLGGLNPGLSDVIYITDVAYTDSPTYGTWESGYTGYWAHPGKTDPEDDTYYVVQFGNNLSPLTLREFTDAILENDEYMRFYWGMWFEEDYLKAYGANTQQVRLTFHFDEAAGNNWQGKSCTFDIVFTATDNRGYDPIWPLP